MKIYFRNKPISHNNPSGAQINAQVKHALRHEVYSGPRPPIFETFLKKKLGVRYEVHQNYIELKHFNDRELSSAELKVFSSAFTRIMKSAGLNLETSFKPFTQQQHSARRDQSARFRLTTIIIE